MTSNKRNAVINTIFRCSSILYLACIGIILVPMYLKYIPVELYGYWLASGNIIAWMGDFTPTAAVMQQRVGVSFGAKDYKMIGHYIGTSMTISLLLLSAFSVILIVFFHFILIWLGIANAIYSHELKLTLLFAGLGTLLTLVSFGFSGINYGLQLFKKVGYLSLSTNAASIVATYLFLPRYGIYALGLALLVRGILDLTGNAIILWHFLRKNSISIHFSRMHTKKMFGDVSFNFFAKLGNLLSKNSQLFFITKFIAPEAAVVFKFTKTIPELSKYFIAVPAEAVMPVFSKYLGQNPHPDDIKAKISKMIFYSLWITGLIFIGFVLLNKIFINLWVGSSFYAGEATNTTIVLWVVVSSITNNLMYSVFALGDLRKNNLALFIQSILFVLLMLLLIRPFGILGIALALLLSETCISLVYYPLSLQSRLQFSRQQLSQFFSEAGKVVITLIAMYILARFIDFSPKSWPGFLIYVTICFCSYLVLMFLSSARFKKEMVLFFAGIMRFANRSRYFFR